MRLYRIDISVFENKTYSAKGLPLQKRYTSQIRHIYRIKTIYAFDQGLSRGVRHITIRGKVGTPS